MDDNGKIAPAPWVPFTRAGCDVGAFATANMEIENPGTDLPMIFGASSPEVQQYKSDTDPYKDQEVADYEGISVHCTQASDSVCNAVEQRGRGHSARRAGWLHRLQGAVRQQVRRAG